MGAAAVEIAAAVEVVATVDDAEVEVVATAAGLASAVSSVDRRCATDTDCWAVTEAVAGLASVGSAAGLESLPPDRFSAIGVGALVEASLAAAGMVVAESDSGARGICVGVGEGAEVGLGVDVESETGAGLLEADGLVVASAFLVSAELLLLESVVLDVDPVDDGPTEVDTELVVFAFGDGPDSLGALAPGADAPSDSCGAATATPCPVATATPRPIANAVALIRDTCFGEPTTTSPGERNGPHHRADNRQYHRTANLQVLVLFAHCSPRRPAHTVEFGLRSAGVGPRVACHQPTATRHDRPPRAAQVTTR